MPTPDDRDETGPFERPVEGSGTVKETPEQASSKSDLQTSLVSFAAGQAIAGRYTLLRRLGERRHGRVCVAETRQPVRRRVALKIIKPAMDTRK